MYDVLFLHRLTPQELAACYRLAELAVNPSFSEGGCPFTFTEALSVDTPVVMARIPVTDEVITCEELRELMLFDPYDWQDMANRIEWGLKNKEVLLQKQKPFYEKLAQRTWTHVVDDYINILEQISEPEKLNNNKLPIDPI
jgi:glycosyltransferase involved in cell wall biosynthesis